MTRWYPPSRPRTVEGGLRARTARGAIGSSWWARRFLDVLESFAMGNRLTRGRAYARKGQVMSLDVTAGEVRAVVQGSRVKPYQVRIGLAPFPELVWAKAEIALSEQALPSAKLLAGEVPPELEEIFATAGAPLFPRTVNDLDQRCSCPDGEVPCKHRRFREVRGLWGGGVELKPAEVEVDRGLEVLSVSVAAGGDSDRLDA